MKPKDEQLSYRVYVLRTWRVEGESVGAPAAWRFSLEDPASRQRLGFPDLDALTRFLARETATADCRTSDEESG